MSTDQQEAEPTEAEEPGEPSGVSERVARAILALVAAGAVWGLVAAFPEIAHVIVGILGTHAWQKARSWTARRPQAPADEPTAQRHITEAEVIHALHFLAAPNVFLSALAAELDLPIEAARALLEQLNVKVRRAVRVGETTGVGVHKDDIPPLPQPLSEDPVDPVDQGQPTNQQGVRIERTEGGFIVYDLTDSHRHYGVTGRRTAS